MQLNRSTQGPYRCQNSKPYVNEKDSSNSKNADATDCTKFHHDHQSKHRTVLLTDWEDFNAGTDQSTFKGTLTPPNPPPLFNRKVSKQICEHLFHLRSVLFAVCQLIQYLVLLQSYLFPSAQGWELKGHLRSSGAVLTRCVRRWLVTHV